MESHSETDLGDYVKLLNERFRPLDLEVREMERNVGGTRKELGLFALRNFKEGELAFKNLPLSTAVLPGRCAVCWKSSVDTPWCCEEHKRGINPNIFDIPADVRLLRGIIRSKDLPDDLEHKTLATKKIDFEQCMYHKPTPELKRTHYEAQKHGYKIEIETLAKFQCNAFAAQNIKSLAVAAGVYLGAILNHSCDPNCVFTYQSISDFDDKIEMQVCRVIKPISKGQELVHSYIPLHDQRATRQAKLQMTYGFQCKCARCSDPDNELDKLLGSPLTKRGQVADRIARKWLETANAEQDLNKEYDLVRKAAKAIAIIPQTNALNIACTRYLWQICQSRYDLEESLRLGKTLMELYDLVSPRYYPEKIHVEFVTNLISRQLGVECDWSHLFEQANIVYGRESYLCVLIADLLKEAIVCSARENPI